MCNILNAQEIKPHKVRYYLERRDPQFKQKMAEVLCVYRQVKLINLTESYFVNQLLLGINDLPRLTSAED